MTILSTEERKTFILQSLLEKLDLPDHAQKKVKERYEDLSAWFSREASTLRDYDLHIFPQGSFLLGTTIRPLHEHERYDLDFACKVREGVKKTSHTQQELKQMIGDELELYRKARHIEEELEEKHRCWRLSYQDEIKFHFDIIPAIPESEEKKMKILESIRLFEATDTAEEVAEQAAKTVMVITDDRHEGYKEICDDWKISNPEGYAEWFKRRMFPQHFMNESYTRAQIDEIPVYDQKTPLQQCIQLLKRHRDQMFADNEESKPISIIITTLAARAYKGETDIISALTTILDEMANYINDTTPRVPNPVHPSEDFTDRWNMDDCRHLQLEQNFRNWLLQARISFKTILEQTNVEILLEQASQRFSVQLNESDLKNNLQFSNTSHSSLPKLEVITEAPSPWLKN